MSVNVNRHWRLCTPPSNTDCAICWGTIESSGATHPVEKQKNLICFFHARCLNRSWNQDPVKYQILTGTDPSANQVEVLRCPSCQNYSFITNSFLKSIQSILLWEENATNYTYALYYSILLITAGAPIFRLALVIHQLSCSLLAKSALNIASTIFFGIIGRSTANCISNLWLQYFPRDQDH